MKKIIWTRIVFWVFAPLTVFSTLGSLVTGYEPLILVCLISGAFAYPVVIGSFFTRHDLF